MFRWMLVREGWTQANESERHWVFTKPGNATVILVPRKEPVLSIPVFEDLLDKIGMGNGRFVELKYAFQDLFPDPA